jgi:hypothetical protein
VLPPLLGGAFDPPYMTGAALIGLPPLPPLEGGGGAWTGLPFTIGAAPVPLTGLPFVNGAGDLQ